MAPSQGVPQERPVRRRALLVFAIVTAAWCGVGVAQALPFVVTDALWQLQRIQYMDDAVTVPAEPTRYTVRLGIDGSVQVRADCNRGVGQYEAEGSGLRFLPIALTRALCPPDSIDSEFVRELSNVVSYVFQDGVLALATALDTSILLFEAAAEK